MPTVLRKLGVHGKNSPALKTRTVEASDFSIFGLIGQFERKYDKTFSVQNPSDYTEIFGNNIDPNFYGPDVVKTFFANLAGVNATAYIKSHVGYNGAAIDAVVASATVTDQNGLTTILALLNTLTAKYTLHEADAKLPSGWAFHKAQELVTHSLASTAAVSTLGDAIIQMNAMKTTYNGHDGEGGTTGAHGVAGSHQVITADATTAATAVTLANAIKTAMNAHAADAAQHTSGADATNFPVSATASGTPAATLKIQAGYKAGNASVGALEFGISGNRTGYRISSGVRFTTKLNGAVIAAATSAVLDSVAGVKVGDIINFVATGGTAAIVTKKITLVNESTKTVTWVGAFSAGPTTGADNDVVNIPGFKIQTYRKSISGVETEVETALGQQWCTMESGVTEYFVENVHQNNKYIKVTDQSSASTLDDSFPTVNTDSAYLTAGADGTSPTAYSHWSRDVTAMDSSPVRVLALCETTDASIHRSMEVYCKARTDTPLYLPVIAENQDKDQLKEIGAGYQRSDDVMQVNVADWVKIDDDFNTAPNAPDRNIPNVGCVAGAWLRSIAILGVHYIPCVPEISVVGINGVENDALGDTDDQDRTDLAEYGVNLIQFVSGSGYRIRNFFTPSTATEYLFANGLLMRNYIKVSAETSLAASENTPNSFARIKEDREAIRNFLYRLWFKGSTGNVPEGESYGQQANADGTLTTPDDHFSVQADAINNPQSDINLGKRTIQVYFSYPSPAGSIEIGCGILLR